MRTRPIHSSSDPMSPGQKTEHVARSALRDIDPPPDSVGEATHVSVLLHEAIDFLNIQPSDVVVDATLGGAGHARALADSLGETGTFIGFDLDSDAIKRAGVALQGTSCAVHLIEANFRTLHDSLSSRGIGRVNKILFDLGWSSFQLSDGRGFSFKTHEPLSMTYEKHPGPKALTAATIVNTWAETSLADIILGWGEDRFSRRIARAIVERRESAPFETSDDLAEVIRQAVPRGKGRIHPATKTFQALRIAVNDELGALTDGLRGAWEVLSPGGRIAVITFHSIEDRLVKRAFAEYERIGVARKLLKKPLPPTDAEILRNPRARSAKLRVIEKNYE